MLVSAPLALGFVGLRFGAMVCPDLTYRIVDEGLQVARIGVGITRFDVLNGAMKNMSADGLLDEFREVALFHSLGVQKGAQREIGLLRDLNVPADCFLHISPTDRPSSAYTLNYGSACANSANLW